MNRRVKLVGWTFCLATFSALIACGGGGGDGSGPRGVAVVTQQQAYVKASNTGALDVFGDSIALSSDGNTLAVGAPGESSNGLGVNPQVDNNATGAGAVFVFTRSGTTWTQQAYLKAFNPNVGDAFGSAVALSGDGNTLVVGAPGEDSAGTGINGGLQADNSASAAGAAYVFTRSGTIWTQQAYIKASNTEADDGFGSSVALNGDGNTLVVGAPGEDSIGIGINGILQGDNNASAAGATYVFTRSVATWTQQAYVKASNTGAGDQFGSSVALSSDGNTLAVGAFGEDSAVTGVGGDQTDNTAANAGAVYVLTRNGVLWTQQAYVKASNAEAGDQFGFAVALSADSNTLVIGAPGEASAATGIGGNQADDTAINAGAIYVFTRNGALWTQRAYVKASNTGTGDSFGISGAVSSDGSTVAAGASSEASAAFGIGGIQSDNTAANAGAVYVFR